MRGHGACGQGRGLCACWGGHTLWGFLAHHQPGGEGCSCIAGHCGGDGWEETAVEMRVAGVAVPGWVNPRGFPSDSIRTQLPGLVGAHPGEGAAPARGPAVAGLPLWADGWWGGRGMQEEGSLHGNGAGQRPGDGFLSKCTLKCVGKQEGAGHGSVAAGPKLGPICLLVAEVMWTRPLSLLPQTLLQQQCVGVNIQGARIILVQLPLYLCMTMQSLITRSHTVFPLAPAHSEKKKKKGCGAAG